MNNKYKYKYSIIYFTIIQYTNYSSIMYFLGLFNSHKLKSTFGHGKENFMIWLKNIWKKSLKIFEFELLESFIWKYWDMGLTWSWGIKKCPKPKIHVFWWNYPFPYPWYECKWVFLHPSINYRRNGLLYIDRFLRVQLYNRQHLFTNLFLW